MLKITPLSNMIDVALSYHSMGFSIFPLWKGTKNKPIVSWKKYMTQRATEDEVRNWWTKYPDANIAIATGNISNLFILDTEKDFDLSSIDIPTDVITAKTGSGGRHFYFRIPHNSTILTHIEIWGSDPKSKADIKGEKGYVVAPPSFNSDLNSYYEWMSDENEITEAPEWLIDFISNLEGNKTSTKQLYELANGVEEGNRNVSATSFIGHILLKTDMDMWEIVAWPAIEKWNEKNNPPMDKTELRASFDSISAREFRRRKGLDTNEDLSDYSGPDRVISSHELSEILKAERDDVDKINSNFGPIDRLCDGYVPGELYVVSGPEKGGKTSFLQFLTKKFSQQNLPVLWFTYEMTPREFLKRYKNLPVFYLPMMNKSYDLKWLEKRIVEAKKKYSVKIVMIDHLEFVLDAAQQNNLSIQLGTVVRYLKSIAREQEIVIFLIHHIRRLNDDEVPSARSLRDSALIAAEADSTLMIWRIPLQKKYKKGDEKEFGNDSMIKVCNHRRTGVIEKGFRTVFNAEENEFIEIVNTPVVKKEVDNSTVEEILNKNL